MKEDDCSLNNNLVEFKVKTEQTISNNINEMHKLEIEKSQQEIICLKELIKSKDEKIDNLQIETKELKEKLKESIHSIDIQSTKNEAQKLNFETECKNYQKEIEQIKNSIIESKRKYQEEICQLKYVF